MIKLTIKEIIGYNYILVDSDNKEYQVNIEFYDLKEKINADYIIYIDKDLLNNINHQIVSFGPLESEYGKKKILNEIEEILILENNKEKIYLQRYYG